MITKRRFGGDMGVHTLCLGNFAGKVNEKLPANESLSWHQSGRVSLRAGSISQGLASATTGGKYTMVREDQTQ